ncbi:MAG: phenylalanyl-tRNA synthetase subunit beta [Bacteroidetes bacterium]|nr:MAG: phenylalanyl-tRNA synthetase subunit beta [Bacteroidota bacterium]
MKISWNWLNEYLGTETDPGETAALLTNCGLEVESVETVETIRGGLRGLVIGEVKECSKHPNADKLSLAKVDVGGENLLSIVCGAPNVAAGQKVVVATVGTTVHPVTGEPFEIKKSKIRGELSEGMICAEDEIGLGESHAGIMVLDANAKVGMTAADYFSVKNDSVLEIGLTPNRADAASHYGAARDLAAVRFSNALQTDPLAEFQPAKLPPASAFEEDLPQSPLTVELENPEACLRYAGVLIGGIEVKPSPEWLQQKLAAIGVRPINNVVDVTNYVLHELGQPLHAFDAAKIAGGKVVVKKLPEGTKFVTLDGIERTLGANDLMICDAEKPMCIAGVFGGLHSGVTETTTSVFLESACFEPVHVRKTSKNLQLKTDSSFRFERGTDVNMVIFALQRAAYLLRETSGGEAVAAPADIYPAEIAPAEIAFSFHNSERLIGKTIDRNVVKKIILSLGIQVSSEGGDALLLSVPPFKVDVKREADVVEEVLRIYGYNNIETPQRVHGSLSFMPKPDPERVQDVAADLLAANGFFEIWNNSLTKASYTEGLPMFAPEGNVAMLNPLSSDLGILRRTLLFGGLETVAYNQNRKQADLRLFEFGKVYAKKENGEFDEQYRLSLFICGRSEPESWSADNKPAGFYELKNFVQLVLDRLGFGNLKQEKISDELISEGMLMSQGKREIVRFGRVAKALLKKTDIAGDAWWADFHWENILQSIAGMKGISYREVSKFPSVRRDLALVLDCAVEYKTVEDLAYQTEKQLLREVNLFDVYEGDKIGNDKKSYAVSFILQDEQATLTDKQIEKVMERLTKAYTEKLGATIRS